MAAAGRNRETGETSRSEGQITRIIVEELSAMYAENKSPQTAAGIINSRVQLYLDEGN